MSKYNASPESRDLKQKFLPFTKTALVFRPGQNPHLEAIWVEASAECQTDLVRLSENCCIKQTIDLYKISDAIPT